MANYVNFLRDTATNELDRGLVSGTASINTGTNRIDLDDGEFIVWRMAYNSKDTYTRVQPAIDQDADRTNLDFNYVEGSEFTMTFPLTFGGGTLLEVSTTDGASWITTPNLTTTTIPPSSSVLFRITGKGYWKTADSRGHDKPILIRLS
jgi:hypothetical protein